MGSRSWRLCTGHKQVIGSSLFIVQPSRRLSTGIMCTPTTKADAEGLKARNKNRASPTARDQPSSPPQKTDQSQPSSTPQQLFQTDVGTHFKASFHLTVPRPGNSSEQMHYTVTSVTNPECRRSLVHLLRKKRVILLVHDFGSDHSSWFSNGLQLHALLQDHAATIIAVDLVGQCASTLSFTNSRPQRLEWLGNDIVHLMNELKLRDVTLVGAGMGCKVILQGLDSVLVKCSLWKHPDEIIRAVVLIDGDCKSNFYNIDEAQFKQAIGGSEYDPYVANMIQQMFPEDSKMPKDSQKRMMEHCCKNMLSPAGVELLASEITFDAAFPMMNLDFLTSKVIVIQSTTFRADGKRVPVKDEFDPWLFLLSQKVPDARFMLVDCGHCVAQEMPTEVKEAIKNMLFWVNKASSYNRMLSWDQVMRAEGYTILPRLPSQ